MRPLLILKSIGIAIDLYWDDCGSFPRSTLSTEGLKHGERQYPNYRKSVRILFQHRGFHGSAVL